MSAPFKMKGIPSLTYGKQKPSPAPMYDSPAQKALVGDQNNLPEDLKASPTPYASPAKNDPTTAKATKKKGQKKSDKKVEKTELNEFGETPKQYKQRMIDMGLRKSDQEEEIDSKSNKEASKKDRKAEGQ